MIFLNANKPSKMTFFLIKQMKIYRDNSTVLYYRDNSTEVANV